MAEEFAAKARGDAGVGPDEEGMSYCAGRTVVLE